MAKAAPNASAPDLAATAVPDPVSPHRARSFLTSLTSGEGNEGLGCRFYHRQTILEPC